MSRFIQSLESRRLLSVTKAGLLADRALILADAAAAKADLKVLAATAQADTRTIQTDLKGSAKTNTPLLRTLKADEVKVLALSRKDVNVLLGRSLGLVNRSIAIGDALLVKNNAQLEAKLAADVAALGTVTAAPLAALEADSQGAGIGAALLVLIEANPTDTTLATDAAKLQTDTGAQDSAFIAAATKFQTDVAVQTTTDLNQVPASSPSGPGGSIPSLVGTLNGSATATSGNNVGRVSTLVVHITSESSSGVLTGTATITNPGQSPQTQNLSGTISASGAFNATVTDPTNSQNGATLVGTYSGKTLSGTYTSTGDGGTFTVTHS